MKTRHLLFLLLTVVQGVWAQTERVEIDGSVGRLRGIVRRPENVKPGKRVPAVVLCHGFTGSKDERLLTQVADSLAAQGIASVRFDFNAHGESEGDFEHMTIGNEVEDARRIFQYTEALPFVSRVGILGHSQGGVVAALLSGELGAKRVKAVALLAPAFVIREYMLMGYCFDARFDPLQVPESVPLFGGGLRLGREYIRHAQRIQPFEAARRYRGPALTIHGMADTVVPYSHSELLPHFYRRAQVHLLPTADHSFSGQEAAVASRVARWMAEHLK